MRLTHLVHSCSVSVRMSMRMFVTLTETLKKHHDVFNSAKVYLDTSHSMCVWLKSNFSCFSIFQTWVYTLHLRYLSSPSMDIRRNFPVRRNRLTELSASCLSTSHEILLTWFGTEKTRIDLGFRPNSQNAIWARTTCWQGATSNDILDRLVLLDIAVLHNLHASEAA